LLNMYLLFHSAMQVRPPFFGHWQGETSPAFADG